MLRRRALLATPASLALGGAAQVSAGLNQRAASRGRFYGCAVASDALTGDAALLRAVEAEAGIIVPENGFKWAALHPAADRFDWTEADAIMAFAARARLRVRGHNLVWHESNPDWLAGALSTPDSARAVLTRHIGAVAGRYRGRIAHWDVVNEPLRPEDKQPFNLRLDPWLRAIGPDYLRIAFEACRAADPGALRVMNEFGMDYAIPWQQQRRESMLALLGDLVARGVPVQALGMQSHLDAAETAFDPAVLVGFLDRVAALGLFVVVTELDVRDDRLPGDIATRDAAVAAHAGAYLRAVLPHKAVLGVLTWGLSDKGSWLNKSFPRPDHLPQRPLPLDDRLARKRMWQAMAEALDGLGGR